MTSRRARAMLTALSAVALLVTSACGNRNSHDDVVAAAQGQAQVGQGGAAGGAPVPGAGGPSAGTTGNTGPGGSTATGGGGGGGTTGATGGKKTGSGGGSGAQDATPVTICQVGHFSGIAAPPMG